MAGIKEVAKKAGVSISTVSNVLNNKSNVGKETREKVLRICTELSYKPNSFSRMLKTGKSNTILFNFSDFDRSFYLRIINGVSDYANDNNYDLIICTDKSCEKYMHETITAGSIVLDRRMKDEVLNKVAGDAYPVIVLDNNYDPMYEMVQGLIHRGYRKFGFIGGHEETADHKERYGAFLDALDANKITFQHKNYFTGNYREKSGYNVAKIMMLSKDFPDCLVCANDNMAIGAMKAFRENGIRIPQDIAVTGFDNCDLAEAMELTTVSIPNYERGYIAAKYLIEHIRGEMNAEVFKIDAKIIYRGSVGEKSTEF